jgi:hypothetical protein
MAITCGVTIGLNNLKGELNTKINAVLDLDLGTPEGLAAIAASIEGTLSDIASKVAEVVVIPPALKSLRGELAELAALPFAGLAAAAKIISIAADYAAALGLSGFANINLTDLAKSVFSISGTFDPCSATIPNITLSPTGVVQKLPSVQPPFGSTLAGEKVFAPDRQINDDLGESVKNNVEVESLSPSEATTAIQSNVTPSITGMGNMVRKLPTGEQVVESRDGFITRIKTARSSLLLEA